MAKIASTRLRWVKTEAVAYLKSHKRFSILLAALIVALATAAFLWIAPVVQDRALEAEADRMAQAAAAVQAKPAGGTLQPQVPGRFRPTSPTPQAKACATTLPNPTA